MDRMDSNRRKRKILAYSRKNWKKSKETLDGSYVKPEQARRVFLVLQKKEHCFNVCLFRLYRVIHEETMFYWWKERKMFV